MSSAETRPRVAIACGGTGGHLFPGLAVAQQLVQRGCRVTLLISPKEIDQQGVRQAQGMEVLVLPAVGLQRGGALAFARGFFKSYREAKKEFRPDPPEALLAMGGFTSAPPLLAARGLGARTFLHESNTIPGRANRWLSRVASAAFVGFQETASRLHTKQVQVTGTPVRAAFFQPVGKEAAAVFGLKSSHPVLLVMGGSQGASAINDLALRVVPALRTVLSDLQVLHLTGSADYEKVRKSYVERQIPASVHAFLERMDLALGTATLAMSRSGASSMAELAAAQLPALLIPYPVATDNHQWHNARAFVETGAALMMEQSSATDEAVASAMIGLLQDAPRRERMQAALRGWQQPQAAGQIAESILRSISRSAGATAASVPNATTGRSSQRNDPTNAAPGRSSQRNDPTSLCEVAAK